MPWIWGGNDEYKFSSDPGKRTILQERSQNNWAIIIERNSSSGHSIFKNKAKKIIIAI